MTDYDVIVVGAGPGGSTAGGELVKKGWKVLILDRAKFPRVKVCAGWITPGILGLLNLRPEDYPLTMQRFLSGSVIIEGKYYHTHYPTTASFGIIRQEFDNFLIQRAAGFGAEFQQQIRIKDIERMEGAACVSSLKTANPLLQKWSSERAAQAARWRENGPFAVRMKA